MATGNKAENMGRWLGQTWRSFVRQEISVVRWMIDRGTPPFVAKSLLWLVKVAVLAILLYTALWLALVLAIVLVAATLAKHANNRRQPVWPITEHTDHRKNSFYDPIAYSDDPDPRFDDE